MNVIEIKYRLYYNLLFKIELIHEIMSILFFIYFKFYFYF